MNRVIDHELSQPIVWEPMIDWNELDRLERTATPGPWRYHEQEDKRAHHVVYGEQKDVARFPPWAGGEVEANAALVTTLRNNAREFLDVEKERDSLIEDSEAVHGMKEDVDHIWEIVGNLRQSVTDLRALLRRMEWSGCMDNDGACPFCRNEKIDTHALNCELAKVLGNGVSGSR